MDCQHPGSLALVKHLAQVLAIRLPWHAIHFALWLCWCHPKEVWCNMGVTWCRCNGVSWRMTLVPSALIWGSTRNLAPTLERFPVLKTSGVRRMAQGSTGGSFQAFSSCAPSLLTCTKIFRKPAGRLGEVHRSSTSQTKWELDTKHAAYCSKSGDQNDRSAALLYH